MELHILFLTSILLFLILAFACYSISRWRYYKLRDEINEREKELVRIRLQEKEEQLRKLIASRQDLYDRNEELHRQLKEVKAKLQNEVGLEKIMEMLHPSLLTNEEEEQFRMGFLSLHPTFLHKLRESCPTVTKGEELYCILVVLNQTNEEIARTLGIGRPSVIKNRYRLRRKINLLPNETLENWIRSLTND